MTKPNDPREADFRATLPLELQSLDRELSGIRIEERPSFAPELEGELQEEWRILGSRGSGPSRLWVRPLLAAGIAGVMIAGLSVPSARAAVIDFVYSVAEALPTFFAPESEAVPQQPQVQVEEPAPVVSEQPLPGMVVAPVDASDEAEVEAVGPEVPTLPSVEVTLPEIISRQEAADIIASHYPRDLQEAGVEGSVRLHFWVAAEGNTEDIRINRGSGNEGLDQAAVRAVQEIRFQPATRNGVPVGTLVEVTVHFFALNGAGIIGSDSVNSGI